MNKQSWNRLPDDVKHVIDGLRREMVFYTSYYHQYVNVQEALRWSRQNHNLQVHSLSEEEKARWDERLEPVIDQWLQKQEQNGLPAEKIVRRVKEPSATVLKRARSPIQRRRCGERLSDRLAFRRPVAMGA